MDLSDVSRETLMRYCDLVKKWNAKINLVSSSSLDDIWQRHIIDSAQIHALAPKSGSWLDIGSGGGFPGMVCALLDQSSGIERSMTFIESDQRKAAFLGTAKRTFGLNVTVLPARIEDAPPVGASIISARALASLNVLLGFVERHAAVGGVALFPKGKTWLDEVEEAKENWSFRFEAHPSKTHEDGAILEIKEIERV